MRHSSRNLLSLSNHNHSSNSAPRRCSEMLHLSSRSVRHKRSALSLGSLLKRSVRRGWQLLSVRSRLTRRRRRRQ